MQLKDPAIHIVLSSEDVLVQAAGGTAWTTKRFHDANPKLYQALINAMKEGSEYVASHPRETANITWRIRKPNRFGHDGGNAERPGIPLHHDTARDNEVGELHRQGRPAEKSAGLMEGFVLAGDP